MTTTTVTTTAALNAAIKTAHAGDVIQLAAGTYSGVTVQNFSSAGAVTITSADPNHHAVITDMQVNNSSGLNFTNLEFSFAASTTAAGVNAFGIQVLSSQNVNFDHDSIHGTLDHDPSTDIRGLNLQGDSNVNVTNSEFQQLYVGIHNLDTTNVTISGNNFHDIRSDGVDNTGVSQLDISDNSFSNFYRVGEPLTGGDHGDAIQFFTQTGQSSMTDITVANNVMVQGAGRNFQGIFVQDMSGGAIPYHNVNITGNLIVGGSDMAIYVGGTTGLAATDVTISNNTIVQTAPAGQTPVPAIHLYNADATLTNNIATRYVYWGTNQVTESGDKVSAPVTDNGLATVTAWMGQNSHPMAIGYTSPTELVNDGATTGPPVSSTPTPTPTPAPTPEPDPTPPPAAQPPPPPPPPEPTPSPDPTPTPTPTPDPSAPTASSAPPSDPAATGSSTTPVPSTPQVVSVTPITGQSQATPATPAVSSQPTLTTTATLGGHSQAMSFHSDVSLLGIYAHDYPIMLPT